MNKKDFKEDLINVMRNSVGNKESTLVAKARRLWNWWEGLIVENEEVVKNLRNSNEDKRKAINALKKGKIFYRNGFVLISEVAKMHTEQYVIVLTLKSGENSRFDIDEWGWLHHVFSDITYY